MKRVATLSLTGVLTLALASPVLAHHSAAAFDTSQQVKITGTVESYRFANPHIYLTLQVKRDNGTTETVEVEAGAASVLNGLGFNKSAISKGDVVTIVGNPGRKDPAKLVLGRELYKRDGAYYPLNISSRTVYNAVNATASSIAGTWFSPMREFGGYMGAAAKWPLTAAAKSAMAGNSDPKATTQKDCVPIGVPAVMFYPVANTITVRKDRVVMKVDWMDSERTVYLDGRKHPPASQTFLHGHSIGMWEGDTLVVETTNFKEHPMGLSSSIPSSSQKKVTERLRLGPDKKTLLYSGIVEDPVYLSKPSEWSGQWEYRPNMPQSNQKCDVEVARKFLRDF